MGIGERARLVAWLALTVLAWGGVADAQPPCRRECEAAQRDASGCCPTLPAARRPAATAAPAAASALIADAK